MKKLCGLTLTLLVSVVGCGKDADLSSNAGSTSTATTPTATNGGYEWGGSFRHPSKAIYCGYSKDFVRCDEIAPGSKAVKVQIEKDVVTDISGPGTHDTIVNSNARPLEGTEELMSITCKLVGEAIACRSKRSGEGFRIEENQLVITNR